MIVIQNVLVSEDLFEAEFACNLNACKGACCVEGDGGAPLDEDELPILDSIRKKVNPFLSKEGKEALDIQGNWVEENWNREKSWSTPLLNRKGACAYVVYENGIALCGIEKAWKAGAVDFQKPISCHLYPIRIHILKDGTEALNYHRWNICSPACTQGHKLSLPVYQFLKGPIVRKYGEDFYAELDSVGQAWIGRGGE